MSWFQRPGPTAANLASAFLVLMPVAWVLGLDQAAWLVVGLTLGLAVLQGRRRPVMWGLIIAFLSVVAISGVLHASGTRWLTLGREVAVVATFWVTVVGVAALAEQPRLDPVLRRIVIAIAVVMLVSSVASLIVFVLQVKTQFRTPIAGWVPEIIGRTGLGNVSLAHRSLGEESYFLGQFFVRPKGLFLFSTSQAVAQAVTIPIFFWAGRRWPSARKVFWAAILTGASAMLVSTTRGPIIALIGAVTLLSIIRMFEAGEVIIRIPLRGKGGWIVAATLLLGITAGLATGLYRPAWDLLTTRSFEGRASLYEVTVDTWIRQPLIGWGTERDWTPTPSPSPTPRPSPSPTPSPVPTPSASATPPPPEDRPPLGSHSQYLGVLFKQGLVGMGLFVGLVSILLASGWRLLRGGDVGQAGLVACLVASLGAGATESLWLDPGTSTLVAISWGLVIGVAAAGRFREAYEWRAPSSAESGGDT